MFPPVFELPDFGGSGTEGAPLVCIDIYGAWQDAVKLALRNGDD
jgi:hypothetical protein